MSINFDIEESVRKRYSVRNYSEQKINQQTMHEIESFIQHLDNPFSKKVNFHFLNSKKTNDEQKLGTYGVIKGAKQYIGTTIEQDPMALVALGYELEIVILYLAHLDLGTCWLGGTFNRKGFASAMNVSENELFPAITPYGYAAAKKHIKEVAMRKLIKADHRKEWDQLFYKDNFETPLQKEEAGELEFPLEMVRLGPSASNKQPWRILTMDSVCHFYEYKEPGYSDRFLYDIQRIDMGIAAAHFDLSVKEKGIQGDFEMSKQPDIKMPENFEYVLSWVRKKSTL